MQLISKFKKRFKSLLCVIDIYSKYAWAIPLNDKTGFTITNAFQKILGELNRKTDKTWVDKGSEFYNVSVKSFCRIMVYKCIQYILKENLFLLKDSLDS